MKKIVLLQIGLAIIALFIVAWVFFKERPQAVENHQLQQQLNQAQQQIQQTEHLHPITGTYNIKESRAYLRQGRDLFHQQQYEPAIAYYDKALESFPDDPYAWSLKGYALYRAGRIPESIEANKKAVQLDPGDPLNFIDLAKSYCAAKQYQDAQRVLIDDPPSDTAVAVRRYVGTDGEIRHVCSPILASVAKSASSATVTKTDN